MAGHNILVVAGIASVVSLITSVITAIVSISLSMGKYKEKVDALEKYNEKSEEHYGKLSETVAKLGEWKRITQRDTDIKRGVLISESPIALTEKGEKLLEDSGFNEIFEKVKDELVRMLEEKKPENKYQTEDRAGILMEELTDYEPFKPLQEFVYSNSEHDLGTILRAGVIKLRDYYFEKHSEITA